MSPVKTGFVGLSTKGWAATVLSSVLTNNPAYEITAVSTTSSASAKASAEKHGAKSYYFGDTMQIARDPDVDLVAIAVRAPYHKRALLPVIEAGKDFFVEWPAGANTAETRELAQAAKQKGLRTLVGLQGRHSAVIAKVREIIDSGAIGAVQSTTVVGGCTRTLQFWGPLISQVNKAASYDPADGTTLLDIAIGHHIDMLIQLLGNLKSISASTAIVYPTAKIIGEDGSTVVEEVTNIADDHVAFSGVLESGVLVNEVWRGGLAPTPGRLYFLWEIDGELGSIRMSADGDGGAFLNVRDPTLYVNGEVVEVESGGVVGMVSKGWEEFTKGEQGTHATIDDAVKVHEVLDAIVESSREGKRVQL